MKKTLLIICAFAFIFFSACTKDKQQQLNDVPTYSSMEQLHQVLSGENLATQSKSKSDQQNHKLYINEVERMYRAIDTNLFRNIDQLKAYVKNNSSWLELTQDENGEYTLLPKYLNHPYSSAMNMDRLFYVGSTLYKVYDDVLLRADNEEAKIAMKNLAEKPDAKSMKLNGIDEAATFGIERILPSDFGQGYRLYDSTPTVGKNRISIVLETYLYSPQNGYSYPSLYYKIRPFHRVMGVWFWCKRTISAEIHLNLDILFLNNTGERKSFCESIPETLESIIERTITLSDPGRAIVMSSSRSWFKTPEFQQPQYIHFLGDHSQCGQ